MPGGGNEVSLVVYNSNIRYYVRFRTWANVECGVVNNNINESMVELRSTPGPREGLRLYGLTGLFHTVKTVETVRAGNYKVRAGVSYVRVPWKYLHTNCMFTWT